MANRPHEITLSTGLLEKLAGLKKPEPPKPILARPALPGIQLPPRATISTDASRLLAQDKQLTRQLQATKEVTGLLLKNEASELQQVGEKAGELLSKYSVDLKTPPCQTEAQACTQCFKEHAADAWRCTEAAEVYRRCSVAAFSSTAAA